MGRVRYFSGGFLGEVPGQNIAEVWDDAAQSVTTYDTAGTVVSTSAYTTQQAADAAALSASASAVAASRGANAAIAALLAAQSALATQIADDAAMFAATPVGSTLASEHITAFVRMVKGFGTVMQAITALLILTGNAPPTTPLS